MKKKIFDALKNKYKNMGFSDQTFNGVADHLATTTTEETEIDNAVTGVESLLKIFQGETDRLRGNAKKLQDQLDALKNDGGTDDNDSDESGETGKPANKGKQKPQTAAKDGDEPAWLKGLTTKLDTALTEIATLKAEKLQMSQSEKVSNLLKEKNVDIESKAVKMLMKGKQWKDDDEMNAFVEEVFEAVGEKVEQQQNNGFQQTPTASVKNIPTPAGGKSGKQAAGGASADFNSYLDEKYPKAAANGQAATTTK